MKFKCFYCESEDFFEVYCEYKNQMKFHCNNCGNKFMALKEMIKDYKEEIILYDTKECETKADQMRLNKFD